MTNKELGTLFHIYQVKWSRVRKMMEKGKMERGVVELVEQRGSWTAQR